ncbi:glycosyltransferase [uncultured Maribacter sp.]|uniref:glycosyltransferase n=1 Tax=uncultured Maribacter sp. TaxID=431308 RepID=UPI00263A2B62|nr:glycosyltransferase [uncultured Maribacter sp.]
MEKIIFYGHLGKKDGEAVGGGESGNLKTLSILKKSGFQIIELRKSYSSKSLLGKLKHYLSILFMPIFLLFKILKNNDVQTVHISGFYKELIYQELLLIYVSKLLGKKCIYELRAGGVQQSYDDRVGFYKFFFRKAITSSDVILVQGERYVKLLNMLGAKKIIHYPNYIMGSVIARKTSLLNRDNLIELVYFGRMHSSKNILLILDICVKLKEKKIPFKLELIGVSNSKYPEYVEEMREKIKKEKLNDIVKLTEPIFGSNLINTLKDKHFYIFPTQEAREGHSNSLTEAMSLGIVPICSDYGFNREIVNSNRLIINEFDANFYANLIIEIWQQNLWKDLSKDMQEIVSTKFTSSIVQSKLLAAYK